ncbi:MAG: GTP-binding protein [Candidatus Manganitrophaceae bacterium]
MTTLVSANIVTGFLGSGKTTLLKSALKKDLGGKKIALIVNDFGEIGVDGTVLQGVNVDRLIELPNGCVCCTVGTQFSLAVQEIVETVQPHLIVIETSGVADPAPLISELSLVGVKTDSVITVVDAENGIRFCRENETAARQVEAADFLVINKIDLVSPGDLGRLSKRLRKLNPRAMLIPAAYGEVSEEILFATGVTGYWKRASSHDPLEHTHIEPHLEKDRITSFSFRKEGRLDRVSFERLLGRLPDRIYRAKGIVHFTGEGWSSLFNYTCGRARIDWLAPASEEIFLNRGVFIGKDLDRMAEKVLWEIRQCLTIGGNQI